MTEERKVMYEAEDVIALGKQMPVVAYRQLEKLLPKIKAFDTLTPLAYDHIEVFFYMHGKDADDERALRDAFKDLAKQHKEIISFMMRFNRI